MYLMVGTRPDIAFAMSQLSKFVELRQKGDEQANTSMVLTIKTITARIWSQEQVLDEYGTAEYRGRKV
jgi:hypothetical protein